MSNIITRETGFAAIPNAAMRDERLSIEARGLLAMMMGMAGPKWQFYADDLQERCGCGRDKYQRMIRELKQAGYLEVRARQDDGGVLQGAEWVIFDDPGSGDNRGPDYPVAGKPNHLRKNKDKKEQRQDTPLPPKGGNDLFSDSAKPKTRPKDEVDAEVVRELSKACSVEMAREFVGHRRDIKKPLTPRAARLMVPKLEGHADPDAVLQESIANGWQGIFPDRVRPSKKTQAQEAEDFWCGPRIN